MPFLTKRIILIVTFIIPALIMIIFSKLLFSSSLGLYIFIPYFTVWGIFSAIFGRCPHCRRALGRNLFFAAFCSRCGKRLED